jgi:hypoxanthine phosphoribosyltransferase
VKKIYYSYQDIHDKCIDAIDLIQASGVVYDGIIAIGTGGLIPAVIIHKRLNIPIEVVMFSSGKSAGDNKNHNNLLGVSAFTRPIIIDDIADSGHTLAEVQAFYQQSIVTDHSIDTLSLIYKPHSCFLPTYITEVVPNNRWVTFPWEM